MTLNKSILPSVFILLYLILCTGACVNDDPFDVPDCSLSGLTVEVMSVQPASGCDVADGRISIAVSGGHLPYKFFLNEEAQSGTEFAALTPGIYSIRVRDRYECEVLLGNVMVPADGLSFSATIVESTECLAGNGQVTIEVTEGNPPYQFALNNGSFSDDSVFSDLVAGDHTILARDNDNCTVTLTVTIPKGFTGTSWSTEILPIMQTSCAISRCHNGISRPDLRVYSIAKKYAAQIKSYTQDRSMPFDGSLSQAEIDIIACWVDDGALEN
jgi:hypothetical protein